MTYKHGLIDIGSNTIRLVIYEYKKGRGFKQIENVKVAARLRNYLSKEGVLTAKGIYTLLDTLKTFGVITRHQQLPHVTCVATATIRQAANAKEVLALVKKETDFSIQLLSEYEEAYYGFVAVIHSTSIEEAITIDIGGGSTEVTYFRNRELVECHSFPFGALSLRLEFVKGNIPTAEEKMKIRDFVIRHFHTVPWLLNRQVPIVAIGGSARSMVQVHQGFIHYPLAGLHQYEMNLADILHVKSAIGSLSYHNLQKLDRLSKDRADTILPAIEVFQSLYETVNATRFILSRKGLREGVLFKEASDANIQPMYPDVIQQSFQEIMEEFEVSKDYVKQLTRTASMMFQHLKEQGPVDLKEDDLALLIKAAQVYDIGKYIDAESSSQHTFYVLANRTIDGISHRERLKLALVSSYKGKSSFRQYVAPFKKWLTKEEQKKVQLLGAVLKIADGLHSTKRNIVQHIDMKSDENTVTIKLLCTKTFRAEQYQAEKQKKHLEKVVKKNIVLEFTKL